LVRGDDEFDGDDDNEEGVAASHQHRLMSLLQDRLSRELAVAPKGSRVKVGGEGRKERVALPPVGEKWLVNRLNTTNWWIRATDWSWCALKLGAEGA
jgi:hypothetical protein